MAIVVSHETIFMYTGKKRTNDCIYKVSIKFVVTFYGNLRHVYDSIRFEANRNPSDSSSFLTVYRLGLFVRD